MIKLMRYFKWYEWIMVVAIIGLTVLQVWVELLIPEYLEAIMKLFTPAKGVFAIPTAAALWSEGLMMLLMVAIVVIISIAVLYLSSMAVSGLMRRVRAEMFKKVGSFSMEEMNKFSTPSLINRTTGDVTQVQNVLSMALRMMISAPVTAVLAVIKIVGRNGELSLVTACAVLALLIMVIIMFTVVVPKIKNIQKTKDSLNSVARENLTGLRVVRATASEDVQEEKFNRENQKYTNVNLFVNRMGAILWPFMTLVLGLMTMAIYWVGAGLINGGVIEYPTLALFTQYSSQIIFAFLMISMLFVMVPRGMVSARRINEVLDTQSKIIEGSYDSETEVKGLVEFKNVSFKYPDADDYVLRDISFAASMGQTIAFIGSTGSGKSTLINLIPRFYDATEGEVLIDGVNVKEYKFEALNKKLGYIPQKGMLFSGTVRENIKYGEQDATDEQIGRALKIAQAQFVEKLDGGLDYAISQGGKNVSGGQRQRLAIARAVVRDPEVYIFDDSFSALDYKTDKALRQALKKDINKATRLIVAQRVGTIMDADKIIVLEHGRMVGDGTHKELMKNCKVYQEIAYSQLSKEELANG